MSKAPMGALPSFARLVRLRWKAPWPWSPMAPPKAGKLATGRPILCREMAAEGKNGVLGFRRRQGSYGGQVGGFRKNLICWWRIAPRLPALFAAANSAETRAAGSFTFPYMYSNKNHFPAWFSL